MACENCGGPIGRRNKLYCSRACHDAAHNITRICPSCRRAFTVVLSHTKNGRFVYCSRKCAAVGRRKRACIEHNGAVYYYTLNGYQTRDTVASLHRVVWEEHNGPIPPNHVVTHKDGDRSNNVIDNLELLSHREHWRRKLAKQSAKCAEPECDRPARQRGLCHRHYQQLRAQERGGWQVVKGGSTMAQRDCKQATKRWVCKV